MKEGGEARPAAPGAVARARSGHWALVCFEGCLARACSTWYCRSVKLVPAMSGGVGFRCGRAA
jgi:hypothetical protein